MRFALTVGLSTIFRQSQVISYPIKYLSFFDKSPSNNYRKNNAFITLAGNKLVQDGKYEEAIARYSEMIMQSRALENETDVQWTEEGRDSVRTLRAAAYLNLSLG